MKVTLVFPPATDPRSPHLALPCLAAVLRKARVDTRLLDLDIEGMLALVDPDNLDRAGKRLRNKYESSTGKDRASLRRLAGLAEVLPLRVSGALSAFHDPDGFYNPNEFNAARETIFDCLDLVSEASSVPVKYNISPIRYDVNGIDPERLPDLVRATANRDANLFADFWENDVFPLLERQSPDLIGITITNRQQVLPGLTLARQLRSRGHFVVLGGTVYSKFVAHLQRRPAFFHYFADGVVVYEGETALLELVRQLDGARDFSKVPNFLYSTGDEVHFTFSHVEDVNELPTPDFDGLPLSKYLTPEPVLPIMFGKGCYFNRCKFCDIPYINSVSPKYYRIRSPERVLDDVVELHGRFGCHHFEFTDEALAPRLLERLADLLEPHRDKGYRFVGYARLEPAFTLELCRKLARMGLKKLFFGLESGAQETLDHMDKGIRMSEVPNVLKNCREAGVNVHIFSIIGFPEETEESARKTYRFFEENASVINHPGNSFDIHPFGLELRTHYFEEAESMGLQIAPEALAKDFIIGVGESWRNTRGLTHEQVASLLEEFHSRLCQVYRKYHATDQQLWPAFEEFAVLYAGRYDGLEFPYMTSLPEEGSITPIELRWNPAALVESNGEGVLRVSSRHGDIEIDTTTYEIFRGLRFQAAPGMSTDPSHVSRVSSTLRPLSRPAIDNLVRAGLLQIQPCAEVERDGGMVADDDSAVTD